MFSRKMRRLAGLSISLAAVSYAPVFAQSTTTLSGTVTDPTGAVLPGAQVVIHSLATGAERVLISDGAGQYVAPSLPPGDYSVRVTAPGFGAYSVPHLTLVVDAKVGLDIGMKPESEGETVQVESSAPMMETETMTVGQVISKETVQEIPLNGRHFLDLTVLTPGGVTAPPGGNLTEPSRGIGSFSFVSAGNRADSVNFQINGVNLNDISNAQIVFQPSINTTSEVKINNSTFSAEYGRNSGSVVNVSTRSGTSQFHGEVFDYNRNNSFDARNFFNKKNLAQASLKRNNFGAAVGGPLYKNKTFFFASYEGLRQHQGLQATATVPTAAQRAATANAVTRGLLNLIPQANFGASTFNGTANGPVSIDQGTLDILQLIGEKDTLHGFYAYQYDSRTEPTTQGNTVPGFGDHRPGYRQIATINETHVFSPKFVNEARLGFNRIDVAFINNVTTDPTTLGFNNYPAGVSPSGGIPQTSISGYTVNIGGPSGFPSGRYDTLGVFSDAATYVLGRHSIKFGGEFRRYLNSNYSQDPGSLSFAATPRIVDAAGNVIQEAHSAIQNFQQGLATSFSITPSGNRSRIYGNAVGGFLMDNFKMTPRFMIEAGFRFEWLGSPTFGNGKATIFDPSNVTLHAIGTPGYSTPYSQNYNYQPRLGFTYDLTGEGKTVLRGGYGYMSDQPLSGLVSGLSSNPPYNSKVNFTATSGTGTCNMATASCLPAIPVESLYSSASASAISVTAVQRDYRNAYTQTFNLNLQHEFPGKVAMMIGYYGSVGRHLRSAQNINQISPRTRARAFTSISADSPVSANAPLNANVTQNSSNGQSNYNGLWLTARKNMTKGAQVTFNYQYTKSMDLGTGPTTQFTDVTQPWLNYGLSDFDVRHRISANGIYDLPFKGNRLVEGFRLASIVQWQTGSPLNITTTSTYTGTSNVQHPDLLGRVPYAKEYNAEGNVNWFANPSGTVCAAGSTPAAGCVFQLVNNRFGNMGRNTLRGPGFMDVDVSLYKTTKMNEHVSFQLRVDAFDVLNHPSFSNPGTSATVGSSSFGVITETRFPVGDLGSSRQLQLAGKIMF